MRTISAKQVVSATVTCGLAFASVTLFSQQVAPLAPAVPVQAVAPPAVPVQTVAPTGEGLSGPFDLNTASATPGGLIIGQSYDGIDFLHSDCFCLPPDTNVAVGNDFVVETVNYHIRVFDKATGSILLDQSLASFFGAFSGGDPYVVYDDTVDRWYVSAFDSDRSGLFLAVSVDGNPVHGFLPTYHLTDLGGFPDYQKSGFNKDAIFISYNDFGPGGGAAATIVSIDKAAALSGTLTYYVSHPLFQFRAMPPAQMHGDTTGGVEWFVSTDGPTTGTTIRVTKLTDYLSHSPTFSYTSLPVSEHQYAQFADQPGGVVTTFPNRTTTQVQYHNGRLVTAMAAGTAADNFKYPKGLVYQVDVSGGTPKLLKEILIDPGPAVAVQMPSVDENRRGTLGLTWMESSPTEYLSMWVATVDAAGNVAAEVAAPGGGIFFANNRIGDYSTTVLDPDGRTFWSANEYIGNDGFSNIWRTHITSFTTVGAIEVSIDLRDSINVRSNGVIQLTILGSSTFDAATVDPLSVTFGRNGAQPVQQAKVHDADEDGLPDLALHFRTRETGITCGDTSASLTGDTFDGQAIEGSVSFRTLGCK